MPASQAFPRGYLLLLALLTLFWGINWPIMKMVLETWPIWSFRTLCVAAGAVGLLAIALAGGQSIRVPAGQWPRLIVISFFNITGWNLFALYGLVNLPSGRAAILAFTMPLWGVLLGRFVLGEPLTPRKLCGLALGLAGLAVLIGGDLAKLSAAPVGALCMIGAAVSWAIGTVLIKRFPIDLPVAAATGWQMALGGLPILVGALLLDVDRVPAPALAPMLGVVYNMIVCFIFCYWGWFKILQAMPAGITALSTMAIPSVGVVSGALALGERPGVSEFTALALIVTALSIVLIQPGALRLKRA